MNNIQVLKSLGKALKNLKSTINKNKLNLFSLKKFIDLLIVTYIIINIHVNKYKF